MSENYYDIQAEKVEEVFDTSGSAGLTQKEARKRLRYFGKNKIYDDNTQAENGVLSLLVSPAGMMFYISAFAAVSLKINGALAAALLWTVGIIVLSVMKMSSQHVISAVHACGIPRARVVRDGKPKLIDSRALVPGDLLFLSEGDIVCADCRIIYTNGIKVREPYGLDEYRVTEKTHEPCPEAISPSEMKNMLFASSTVTYGGARAVVTSTGRDTLALVNNGGNPLTLRGTESSLYKERTQKTERNLCILSAGCLFALCILLLVAAPANPIEYFFISAASLSLFMSGAYSVIAEYALASTVSRLSESESAGCIVKNISAMDKLCEVDALICGEVFAFPFLSAIGGECAKYKLSVFITAHPENASDIAQRCGGTVCLVPSKAHLLADRGPVVVAAANPTDRASLAASLAANGYVTAAVASKSGHIGMFNMSAVSFCCASVDLSAKKITDITLEDIDRSAGNEAMMKNSDILCRPTLASVLSAIGSARMLSKKLGAMRALAYTSCIAMIFTVLLSAVGASTVISSFGAVLCAFPISLISQILLASSGGSASHRPSKSYTRLCSACGILSSVLWLALVISVRVYTELLGINIEMFFTGFVTCSAVAFLAFSLLFSPLRTGGRAQLPARLIPSLLVLGAVVFALFFPTINRVVFENADVYILILSLIPAFVSSLIMAVNREIILKVNKEK